MKVLIIYLLSKSSKVKNGSIMLGQKAWNIKWCRIRLSRVSKSLSWIIVVNLCHKYRQLSTVVFGASVGGRGRARLAAAKAPHLVVSTSPYSSGLTRGRAAAGGAPCGGSMLRRRTDGSGRAALDIGAPAPAAARPRRRRAPPALRCARKPPISAYWNRWCHIVNTLLH